MHKLCVALRDRVSTMRRAYTRLIRREVEHGCSWIRSAEVRHIRRWPGQSGGSTWMSVEIEKELMRSAMTT
jgi:hypothetical protein